MALGELSQGQWLASLWACAVELLPSSVCRSLRDYITCSLRLPEWIFGVSCRLVTVPSSILATLIISAAPLQAPG